MYNDELISNSKNRIKTTWEIIKKETGKFKHHSAIESLRIMRSNPREIAQYLNDYFLYLSFRASQVCDI